MKRVIIKVVTGIIIFTMALVGCSNRNVDENESLVQGAVDNFDIIISNNIENKIFHGELNHFGFLLGNGEKFEWTSDPSTNEADFSLTFNAEEFVEAGLDVKKLNGDTFKYIDKTIESPGVIVYTSDVSNAKEPQSDYKEAFKSLLIKMPGQLSVIEKDGYILDIGKGFQVHWNGEERVNKDIAFIINPEDLVEAGLNIEKLTNWKVMNNNENGDEQLKLFKVYYLK